MYNITFPIHKNCFFFALSSDNKKKEFDYLVLF